MSSKQTVKEYDVIVLGAGASGLMAAVSAASEGASAAILEKRDVPAKKLYATGNGRCNLTNTDQDPRHYHGTDPSFALQALRSFSETDTLKFFRSFGVMTRERDGYVYPYSNRAGSVVSALLSEVKRMNVPIFTGISLMQVSGEDGAFTLKDEDEIVYSCRKLIVSTGLYSSVFALDKIGIDIAKMYGIEIIKPLPSLVPLSVRHPYSGEASGVRAYGEVSVIDDSGNVRSSDKGEIQFTEKGLSGIPVMNVSRDAVRLLDSKKPASVILKLFPDMEKDELTDYFISCIAGRSSDTCGAFLSRILPEKLAVWLLRASKLRPDALLEELAGNKAETLSEAVYEVILPVISCTGAANAQTMSGGIAAKELRSGSMESIRVPGLYFTGELIDIDGDCGGYNLQWAWTSGHLAGSDAARSLKESSAL